MISPYKARSWLKDTFLYLKDRTVTPLEREGVCGRALFGSGTVGLESAADPAAAQASGALWELSIAGSYGSKERFFPPL